jgi:hypothetical protein
MNKLENLGSELFSIANRIEDIRVELYRNEEYKKLFLFEKEFQEEDDRLFKTQSDLRDLAHFLNSDLDYL